MILSGMVHRSKRFGVCGKNLLALCLELQYPLVRFWRRRERRLRFATAEGGTASAYSRGWSQEVPLPQALTDSRARDESKGQTHSGPHRADVLVRMAGRPAREVLSRGQQKLVAIAMTLAQIQLLQERTSLAPTLLLDDPAAELDGPHLLRFIEEVGRLNCQLVLTSLQPHLDLFGKPERVFHVEQGGVGPV